MRLHRHGHVPGAMLLRPNRPTRVLRRHSRSRSCLPTFLAMFSSDSFQEGTRGTFRPACKLAFQLG